LAVVIKTDCDDHANDVMQSKTHCCY